MGHPLGRSPNAHGLDLPLLRSPPHSGGQLGDSVSRLFGQMVKVATMQETIQVLLGLQELDTKIYSVKDELRRLPAERERRRKALDARIATRDEYDSELRRLHLQIKEVDMDTTRSAEGAQV